MDHRAIGIDVEQVEELDRSSNGSKGVWLPHPANSMSNKIEEEDNSKPMHQL